MPYSLLFFTPFFCFRPRWFCVYISRSALLLCLLLGFWRSCLTIKYSWWRLDWKQWKGCRDHMLTTNRTGYFAGRVNFTTSSISIRGIQTWFLFVLEAVKGSVRVFGENKKDESLGVWGWVWLGGLLGGRALWVVATVGRKTGPLKAGCRGVVVWLNKNLLFR
jgi:hypothetical protein